MPKVLAVERTSNGQLHSNLSSLLISQLLLQKLEFSDSELEPQNLVAFNKSQVGSTDKDWFQNKYSLKNV